MMEARIYFVSNAVLSLKEYNNVNSQEMRKLSFRVMCTGYGSTFCGNASNVLTFGMYCMENRNVCY
jgi:hypothetical protein